MDSLSDRQNQTGLARLRERYCRRAERIIAVDSPLIEMVREFQRDWAQRFPDLPIGRDDAPAGLSHRDAVATPLRPFSPIILNDRLHTELNARLARPNYGVGQRPKNDRLDDATSLLEDIAWQIAWAWWPWPYFTFQGGDSHPCLALSSALLAYRWDSVYPLIWDLVAPFKLTMQSLPYVPDPRDRMSLETLRGQHAFLLRTIRELVGDDDSHYWDIVRQAREAGSQESAEAVRAQLRPKPSDQFWYVPVWPGMAAQDLESAGPRIAGQLRDAYGPAPLDDMIAALCEDGMSQTGVADLLGVHKNTVSSAMKARRERDSY